MKNLYIGIMSGTSLDGIDLALADFSQGIKLVHQTEYPYPKKIKAKLLPLSQGQKISLNELGTIDHLLGQCYAKAVNDFVAEFNIDKKAIAAIGCHGQTVFHKPHPPTPFTMQLGDPNLIAALTSITTVADFRRKDMAFGGQGAPLVPAFHQALFTDKTKTCVVVNIGGIANISVLVPNQKVIGFDTGPGNMLMDHWIELNLQKSYDKNGDWAASGQVNTKLLQLMLTDPYFALSAPKSTGREYFHAAWLDKQLSAFRTLKAQDVQASLLALTASSIAMQILHLPAGELLVCGGGAKNTKLLQALKEALNDWQVQTTDEKGIDASSLEAMAFAWLAYRTLHRQSGNLPEVTGATTSCSLGAIYYPD